MTPAGLPVLPQTCYPAVWLWPGHALYAGPGLNLTPHSGTVWCLAVGADCELTVTAGDARVVARSVLIPPRLVHHLDTHGGRLVSAYFDESSGRVATCRARCRQTTTHFAIDHTGTQSLVIPPRDDDGAQRWLEVAAPETARRRDPRIADALTFIAANPTAAAPARQLAAQAGLSESRFLHLFRIEVGTSLRRYRLWMRLIAAGTGLRAGRSLTEAAADAGFASPSHLSDRFRSTFGLTASELLRTGAVLRLPGLTPSPNTTMPRP